MPSAGFVQWKLAFGISPIIFVGGIALNMPGGQMPIISVTDAGAFASGPLGPPSSDPGLDGFFATYEPLPGGTLEDFEFGKYPFANQSVAANAVIQEPLQVSMLMICPVKGNQTWGQHLSIITSLQSAMQQHAALGGSYTVATPKYIYTNCLLRKLTDATAGDSLQPQSRWTLDFELPLITLQQAQQAQNGLMAKMSSGTQLSSTAGSSFGGLSNVIGSLPAGISPAGALSVLSTGIPSFNASALLSGVLPNGATMAGALTSLNAVIPASLSPNSALQILSGVVPAGISPSAIPALQATLAPAGINPESASALLTGSLPGGVSPSDMLTTLAPALPAGLSPTAGFSLLSNANVPLSGIPLSGGIPTLGQPLTGAAIPTIPASLSLPAAGAPTASSGAYSGLSANSQAFLATPGAAGLPGNF